MNRKASFVVDPFYSKNRIFDLQDKIVNRDDCMFAFSKLRDSLAEHGFDLQTDDLHPISESDLIIYNEMPSLPPPPHLRDRSWLLLFETELVRPLNWNFERHSHFRGIFTWRDDLIDQQRYFKMNFAHRFPPDNSIPQPTLENFHNKKLCTLIAGNKSSSHPLELYSARRKAITTFESTALNDFDYYGIGWERPYLQNSWWHKALRKVGIERILPTCPTPSYKGKVESKLETLRQFRYCICFENARDIPGYITEKIFDCFWALCVPIYWGAPNVTEHIPKECFIDFREYNSSYLNLIEKIKRIKPDQYLEYQMNIYKYITNSKTTSLFNAENFARSITDVITRH